MAALDALPALQREALVLRYYAGLPEAEMAAVMGISRRSAAKHLTRALSALRGRLRPPGGSGQPQASRRHGTKVLGRWNMPPKWLFIRDDAFVVLG